jgi:ankyrin repeat protein
MVALVTLVGTERFISVVEYNKTILFRYIEKNQIQKVEKHLEKYPEKIDKQEYKIDLLRWNYTPLHYACSLGNYDIVKLLVTKGANVNNLSPGQTPLASILCTGHPERINIAYYLIENGADPTITKSQTDDVLSRVLRFSAVGSQKQIEQFEFIMFLFDNSYFNYLDSTEDGLLIHSASVSNNVLMLEYMLEKGIDVNTLGAYDRTPLIYSAILGATEAAAYLLENGADKELKDKGGKTAFDVANERGYKDFIDLLSQY